MIKAAWAHLNLLRSLYFAERNRPEKARFYFQKSLVSQTISEQFVGAYDARIFMMEGKHAEAKIRLSEVSAQFEDSESGEGVYICNYCKFFLAIYEKDDLARSFKAEAVSVGVGGNVERFLPFFSDSAIDRILNSTLEG